MLTPSDKMHALIMPFSPAWDWSTEVAEWLEKIKEEIKETQEPQEVSPAQWHSQCWAILAGGCWWRRNPHLADTSPCWLCVESGYRSFHSTTWGVPSAIQHKCLQENTPFANLISLICQSCSHWWIYIFSYCCEVSFFNEEKKLATF